MRNLFLCLQPVSTNLLSRATMLQSYYLDLGQTPLLLLLLLNYFPIIVFFFGEFDLIYLTLSYVIQILLFMLRAARAESQPLIDLCVRAKFCTAPAKNNTLLGGILILTIFKYNKYYNSAGNCNSQVYLYATKSKQKVSWQFSHKEGLHDALSFTETQQFPLTKHLMTAKKNSLFTGRNCTTLH